MSLLIRPITEHDFEQWLPLWLGYNAFYGRSGDTALPEDITQLSWQRLLSESEPMYALVAERDGKLVGLTHYLYHRSTILRGPSCYLQDLFTDPSCRGQGVGRQLIEAVAARAFASGAERLYWGTYQDNATARRLYDTMAKHTGGIIYTYTRP